MSLSNKEKLEQLKAKRELEQLKAKRERELRQEQAEKFAQMKNRKDRLDVLKKVAKQEIGKPKAFSKRSSRAVGGMRMWSINKDGDALESLSNGMVWQPGVNFANSKPEKRGHNGFNSFFYTDEKTSDSIYRQGGDLCVWGLIAGAGHTQIHKGGWRSQEAQILALYCPSFLGKSQQKKIKNIGERYGVIVCDDYSKIEDLISSLDIETFPEKFDDTRAAIDVALGRNFLGTSLVSKSSKTSKASSFWRDFYQVSFVFVPTFIIIVLISSYIGQKSDAGVLDKREAAISKAALIQQDYYQKHGNYTDSDVSLNDISSDWEGLVDGDLIEMSVSKDLQSFEINAEVGMAQVAREIIGKEGSLKIRCGEESLSWGYMFGYTVLPKNRIDCKTWDLVKPEDMSQKEFEELIELPKKNM